MANKWNFNKQVSLVGESSKNLQKIVQFYIWETPVSDTSAKGRSFREMGIQGAKYKSLQAELRRESGFPAADGHDWIRTTAKDIESKLNELNRFNSFDCSQEFAVHTVKTGLGKTEALFYMIRNAFAHGGFRICKFKGEKYYALESRQGTQIKGRAVLRESTLLAWIQLINKKRQ